MYQFEHFILIITRAVSRMPTILNPSLIVKERKTFVETTRVLCSTDEEEYRIKGDCLWGASSSPDPMLHVCNKVSASSKQGRSSMSATRSVPQAGAQQHVCNKVSASSRGAAACLQQDQCLKQAGA